MLSFLEFMVPHECNIYIQTQYVPRNIFTISQNTRTEGNKALFLVIRVMCPESVTFLNHKFSKNVCLENIPSVV